MKKEILECTGVIWVKDFPAQTFIESRILNYVVINGNTWLLMHIHCMREFIEHNQTHPRFHDDMIKIFAGAEDVPTMFRN